MASFFVFAATFSTVFVFVHSSADWDYLSTEEWAEHYPACAKEDESPINVETESVIEGQCAAELAWEVNYDQHSFTVINNGHSLKLVASEIDDMTDMEFRRRRRRRMSESTIVSAITKLNSEWNTIARFPDYFAPDDSTHAEFCLDSFHMHWGKTSDYGSEHTIDGEHFPLEMHFVHFSCDEKQIQVAIEPANFLNDEDPYLLAVVGILFEVSETNNPAFDVILADDVLEKIRSPDDITTLNVTEGEAFITGLDLSDLIPSDIRSAGYYAYEGSLTTPPCYDIVRWHLMKATSTISEEQLIKLRTLLNTEGDAIAPNYREIQSNVNDVMDCNADYVIEEELVTADTSEPADTVFVYVAFALISVGVIIVIVLVIAACCWCFSGPKNRPTDLQPLDEVDESDVQEDEPEADALIDAQ